MGEWSLDRGVSSELFEQKQTNKPVLPKLPVQPTSTRSRNVVKKLGRRKCRRSYVKKLHKNHSNKNKYTVIGSNCNGILGKQDSLLANIRMFNPSVVMLQETKVSRVGQIKIPSFQIFEAIRQNKEGGSLMTAVHENLNPVFISEGENGNEILVVQAEFGSEKCRFINGYGPQENSNRATIIEFYSRMDQEIKNAKMLGCLVCICIDANAKLGGDIIPGDPHPMSQNGDYLLNLIELNNLVICNADKIAKVYLHVNGRP